MGLFEYRPLMMLVENTYFIIDNKSTILFYLRVDFVQ